MPTILYMFPIFPNFSDFFKIGRAGGPKILQQLELKFPSSANKNQRIYIMFQVLSDACFEKRFLRILCIILVLIRRLMD